MKISRMKLEGWGAAGIASLPAAGAGAAGIASLPAAGAGAAGIASLPAAGAGASIGKLAAFLRSGFDGVMTHIPRTWETSNDTGCELNVALPALALPGLQSPGRCAGGKDRGPALPWSQTAAAHSCVRRRRREWAGTWG